ncbi:hypothetical protein [Mesorhizobium sp. ES1-1]|uniref:hypothetical protein n=1 Tax=Mesorhizobium sp. ES1-1 TaxID=2876629 RepID=UPI001CC979D2|nr:hypothetical protein [Mesorhizobium sp. ES1-1]MBZ9674736.1 hypothetical protein [Mesorhizobium sp. ES1-1]
MKSTLKVALVGLVASVAFGPASALAQDACSCSTAYIGSGTIGSITHVNGDAMVSQAAGYESAKAGNVLDFGSRVVAGPKGSASVQVGGCNISVPANSTLDISRVGNKICLKVLGSEQTAALPENRLAPRFGFPELFFAGALLTTGVAAATQNDDNPVSQ